MDKHRENFRAWYERVLLKLFPDRDAGFAILLVTFPLLERLLRHRVGLSHKDNLNDPFFDAVVAFLPEAKTRIGAREFWQVFRNGLSHEVTLSREARSGTAMPVGWLSHDGGLYSVDAHGALWLHPVLFAERVLQAINNDFSTFVGPSSSTQLPQVVFHAEGNSGGYNVYQGTRGG